MKVVAIIQARLGSTRLPSKVLVDLCGKPLLARVIERTKAARGIDQTVVATTTSPTDDALAAWVTQSGQCEVFRGSEEDVLDRYHQCARLHGADLVVRVTADDPLKDPELIERGLALLAADPALDYCSNTLKPSYPEGLDIELFRFAALDRAHREAKLASEREHVTPYIWKHPDRFKVLNFAQDQDLSAWRWTVDKPEDLEFMREVFGHFAGEPLVSYRAIIPWLAEHPEIRSINANTVRNEGYLKSIARDRP